MSVLAFPRPALDDAQARRDALNVRQSYLVEAPAGSGKTGLLIQRYLKLLTIVSQPESVLALTFTNKAAGEMRHRVLAALEAAQQPLPDTAAEFERQTWSIARAVCDRDADLQWNLRVQPHRLNLRTIDSLCGEIARAVPVFSGGIGQASPSSNPMPLYRAAAHAVFMQLGGEDTALNHALEVLLLHRDADLANCETLLAEMLATREQWASLVPLGAGLKDDATLDREVRPHLDAALESVLCSALTQIHRRFSPGLLQQIARIAHMLADAEGYQGKTNPLLACGSMPHAPGTQADDLRHWEMLAALLVTSSGGWRKSFSVNHLGFRITPVAKMDLMDALDELRQDDTLLSLLCGLRDLPPRSYPDDQWRVAKCLFRLLYHALIELKLLFAEREVCDFTEISLAARAALQAGDADRIGMRLEHLLVDETQDTSSAQYELLEALTSGWNGIDQTVFLVGDPKQSIYLFRQARVERFLGSMRSGRLGDIPVQPLRLTSNFRSGAGLVHAFNDAFSLVFADAEPIDYTAAYAALDASADDVLDWHITPQAAAEHGGAGRLQREEAETIAAYAHAWCALSPGRSLAVLVRSRSHAARVMRKLAEAAVPFRAVDMEPLGERQEVLDAVAITRALLHPADRTAWLAVLRAPWCGLTLSDLHVAAAGDDRTQRKQALRLHLRERAHLLPVDAQLRLLRTLDVLDRAVENRGRAPLSVDVDRTWHALQADLCVSAADRRNVQAYIELLERLEMAGDPIDTHLLQDSLTDLYAEAETVPGAVEVLTIHKAKGLEWDAVLVPALQRAGQQDRARLLDWMELPDAGADGRAQVLLAPVQKRGDEPNGLNRFLRKARTAAAEAELKRLFYVAATRARTSLQLFASPAAKTDGTLCKAAGTLLSAAWTAAESHFPTIPGRAPVAFPATTLSTHGLALAAEAMEFEPKLSPSNFQRLPEEVLRQPIQPLSLKPHAQTHFDTAPSRPSGSLAARVLGTTVHSFLQYMADTRATGGPLPVDVERWGQRVRSLVRAAGLPTRDTEHICAEVLRALRNTLAHDEGLWLLAPHAQAVNEGELFSTPQPGAPAARVERYRFDRSFFAGSKPLLPGSDVLWIVEYKTATRRGAEFAGPIREDFLQAERDRYAAHLDTYARLSLQAIPRDTPVMLAIYHPLLPHLDYWPYRPAAEVESLALQSAVFV